MVTHQLQVRCRPGKVRRSETDILPLRYTINCVSVVRRFHITVRSVLLKLTSFVALWVWLSWAVIWHIINPAVRCHLLLSARPTVTFPATEHHRLGLLAEVVVSQKQMSINGEIGWHRYSREIVILCRLAWVGFVCPSVCLFVCPQHNSKTNDPKVFKLGIGIP